MRQGPSYDFIANVKVKIVRIISVIMTGYCVFYQMAVSMYCRLGFAKKKGTDTTDDELHPSWKDVKPQSKK